MHIAIQRATRCDEQMCLGKMPAGASTACRGLSFLLRRALLALLRPALLKLGLDQHLKPVQLVEIP